MTLRIIGAGVGRTGTYSLKAAINQLGFGPCHHMEEVLLNMQAQLPPWAAAVTGHPDWAVIYNGYESAVDWPTAGFYRELSAAYPKAKFVLTVRSPESWAASFSETIYKLLAGRAQAPAEMRPLLDMAEGVLIKTGFVKGLDTAGLIAAFKGHTERVASAIPADRLLTYEVKEGWGPLCAFLGVPAPSAPFPRTNGRAEFWDRLSGKT